MATAKHINFFELRDACAESGCPLCRIVVRRAEQYIDNTLFEHVSDRSFRKAYRLAGGFCAFHSRGLESFRDGLAVAILGRDILEDRLIAFKKRKPWRPVERCPVCVEQDNIEKEYLTFLIQSDHDENGQEVRAYFTASEGLCAPHYARLISLAKRIPAWLTEFHERKFETLFTRTSQFIELSAYGQQEKFAQLDQKDKLVWKELALNLRGNRD
ncbi:MAG: hypothetical protein LBJ41_05670 [Treponema sp.]|jgi:hypothetical protein|nr:hypothetical protein [Treponema sp.]